MEFLKLFITSEKATPKIMLSYMKFLCAVQRTIFDTHVYLSYIKYDVCTLKTYIFNLAILQNVLICWEKIIRAHEFATIVALQNRSIITQKPDINA